jgi:hypothetical protein
LNAQGVVFGLRSREIECERHDRLIWSLRERADRRQKKETGKLKCPRHGPL